MEGLEDRYISRFEMALAVELKTPDYNTRLCIVESKAAELDLILSDEVKIYLAENITSSVRAIEGALTVLSARHRK